MITAVQIIKKYQFQSNFSPIKMCRGILSTDSLRLILLFVCSNF